MWHSIDFGSEKYRGHRPPVLVQEPSNVSSCLRFLISTWFISSHPGKAGPLRTFCRSSHVICAAVTVGSATLNWEETSVILLLSIQAIYTASLTALATLGCLNPYLERIRSIFLLVNTFLFFHELFFRYVLPVHGMIILMIGTIFIAFGAHHTKPIQNYMYISYPQICFGITDIINHWKK